jgi:hypothetical protein
VPKSSCTLDVAVTAVRRQTISFVCSEYGVLNLWHQTQQPRSGDFQLTRYSSTIIQGYSLKEKKNLPLFCFLSDSHKSRQFMAHVTHLMEFTVSAAATNAGQSRDLRHRGSRLTFVLGQRQ